MSRKHFTNLDDALAYYDKTCNHNPEDYDIDLYDNRKGMIYCNHMTELIRLNYPETYRNVSKKKKAEPHPFGL